MLLVNKVSAIYQSQSTILFSFSLQPNMPLESNVILNVKGDVLERYSIVLHALVVTKDEEDN